MTNFAILENESRCRLCNQQFSSNNKLHQYVRTSCSKKKRSLSKTSHSSKLSTDIFYISEAFIIKTTKASIEASSFSSIMDSFVDSSKNIEIEYEFRRFTYAKVKSSLVVEFSSDDMCLDIEARIILRHKAFFKSQTSNTSIRTMTTSLSVRGLSIYKHDFNEYALVDFYFENTKNEKSIRAHFRRELHLVDDLKVNVLVEMNVLEFEGFLINLDAKTTFIKSCEVIISIETKFRTFENTMHQSVHLQKTTIVFSNSKMLISVHHEHLFERDFMFEFDSRNEMTLFAHIVDASLHSVLVRNDDHKIVQLLRNLRLETILDLDYSNVFTVDFTSNTMNLVIRELKAIHKIDWFKRVLVTSATFALRIDLQKTSINHSHFDILIVTSKSFVVVYVATVLEFTRPQLSKFSTEDVILSNDVTIFNFDYEAMRDLIKTV